MDGAARIWCVVGNSRPYIYASYQDKAIGIAAVCEVLGAVTLGHGVADTLTKKISYIENPTSPTRSMSRNLEVKATNEGDICLENLLKSINY